MESCIFSSQENKFDYVIVGGGTGGFAIAKPLAEDLEVTVAVIKAGVHYQCADPLLKSIPRDVTFAGTKESLPIIDWGFFTPEDPASGNKKRSYARGECFGGRYVHFMMERNLLMWPVLPGTS